MESFVQSAHNPLSLSSVLTPSIKKVALETFFLVAFLSCGVAMSTTVPHCSAYIEHWLLLFCLFHVHLPVEVSQHQEKPANSSKRQ